MVSDLRKNWCKALQKMTGSASFKYQAIHSEVLLREEILHHRGCKKPCNTMGYNTYQLVQDFFPYGMFLLLIALSFFRAAGWTQEI